VRTSSRAGIRPPRRHNHRDFNWSPSAVERSNNATPSISGGRTAEQHADREQLLHRIAGRLLPADPSQALYE